MPMSPDQIERAQGLLSDVDLIRQAHACVITGDFSVDTVTDDDVFKLVDDEAYERIKDKVAAELAASFENKLSELRALDVDVSEFKLSQASDYR